MLIISYTLRHARNNSRVDSLRFSVFFLLPLFFSFKKKNKTKRAKQQSGPPFSPANCGCGIGGWGTSSKSTRDDKVVGFHFFAQRKLCNFALRALVAHVCVSSAKKWPSGIGGNSKPKSTSSINFVVSLDDLSHHFVFCFFVFLDVTKKGLSVARETGTARIGRQKQEHNFFLFLLKKITKNKWPSVRDHLPHLSLVNECNGADLTTGDSPYSPFR